MDNASKNSAGLRKELSPLNVWALAFGCIIGGSAFFLPGHVFLPKAGPLGTAIGMCIAVLLISIIAANYHFMINWHPVSGGEFTYAQNAFGMRHAFVCSWFLGLAYLMPIPLNATLLGVVGRNLLGDVFRVGFHYNVAGYEVYLVEIVLAIGALIVFAWLNVRGVKFTGLFQSLLAIALIGGVAVVSFAAVLSPSISAKMLLPALPEGCGLIAGVSAILVVAPWCFLGFDTVPQSAEEFSFSHRKTSVVMILAIVFGGLVYIALSLVTTAVVPAGYETWHAYMLDLKNVNGLLSLPTFHAGCQLLGRWGLVFLGISVVAASLSGVVGFYMAGSRLLYSMARENVLPNWFGRLHGKHGTPKNAILFALIFSIIAPFFGRTVLGWIVNMTSFGAAIGFAYTSAATIKYARLERNFLMVLSGGAGVLMSVALAILLLVPLPGLDCSFGAEEYIVMFVWIVLGTIFYRRSKIR